MSARAEILQRIAELLDGRPVRWADPSRFIGDYDGRDRTLEVFNADAHEQRGLLRSMRPIREELEAMAGGPVVVIFHTRAESSRLHSGFVTAHEDAAPLRDLARRIRERLFGSTIEFVRAGGKNGVQVELGNRSLTIVWDRQTGFDIRLDIEPFVDRDPDFRISDGERALLSVSMLLAEEAKDVALADELEGLVLPEPGAANPDANIDAPPSLGFEDQIVGQGMKQPPRTAA